MFVNGQIFKGVPKQGNKPLLGLWVNSLWFIFWCIKCLIAVLFVIFIRNISKELKLDIEYQVFEITARDLIYYFMIRILFSFCSIKNLFLIIICFWLIKLNIFLEKELMLLNKANEFYKDLMMGLKSTGIIDKTFFYEFFRREMHLSNRTWISGTKLLNYFINVDSKIQLMQSKTNLQILVMT